jgi:uncharacterized circularly permuted ATP-grasp superfamily protein
VASDIYAHIAGVDIVRAGAGELYVLEDNLRVPSGVSCMLEDHKIMMRLFPELFARYKIAPVGRQRGRYMAAIPLSLPGSARRCSKRQEFQKPFQSRSKPWRNNRHRTDKLILPVRYRR